MGWQDAPVVKSESWENAPIVEVTPPTRGSTSDGIPIERRATPNVLTKLGRGVASLADVTVGGVLPGLVQQVGYPIARALQQSPEAAARNTQAIAAPLEKPFGKLFGVTETPEYQQEAARQLTEFLGANVSKGAKWLSEKTGVPESDVANMLGTSLTAVAPTAMQAVPKTISYARTAAKQAFNLSPETIALGQKFQELGGKVPLHSLSTNRVAKMAGDWIENLPLSGSPKQANVIAINKELVRQIGGDDTHDLLTPAVFGPAMEKSGQTIGNLFSKVTVPADSSLTKPLTKLRNEQKFQTTETGRIVNAYIDNLLSSAENGVILGERLRAENTALGTKIRQLPIGDLRNQLSDLQEIIMDTVTNQLSQKDSAALALARAQYAKGKFLEPLVAKGQDSGITPSDLMNRQLATPAGKHRIATGTAGEMGDLAALSQKFMRSVTSSGLGERGFVLGALSATGKVIPGLAVGNIYNRLGPVIASKLIGKSRNALAPAVEESSMLPAIYAQQGTVLPPNEYVPNWVSKRNVVEPDIRVNPPPEITNPRLAAPITSEMENNWANIGKQRERQYTAAATADQLAAQRAAEAEAAQRVPTGTGQVYDIDPITGRLKSASEGLKGATPDTITSTGHTLASAVDKLSSGQAFALSAEERIAWAKSKTDLASVAPEFSKLSDKAVAERMMDRQWVSNAVIKAREQARGFDEIAKRAEGAAAVRKATIERDRLMDLADSLDEQLSTMPLTKPKMQGPKTRAAQRNALRGDDENQNRLAPQ